jgi:hypothetical protein
MQLLLVADRQTCDGRAGRHALDQRAPSLFTVCSQHE